MMDISYVLADLSSNIHVLQTDLNVNDISNQILDLSNNIYI